MDLATEDWFRRRAEEALARGEIRTIYEHREVVTVKPAIDPKLAESAYQLGYAAGQYFAKLLDSTEPV